MYSWYTLDTASLENPCCLKILEIEWPMRHAPTICPRSKASKSGSLPILAIPTANSEQPQICCGHGSLVVKIKDSWLACQDFEPCALKTCRVGGAMYVKSVESLNVLPLVWYGSYDRVSASSGVVLVTLPWFKITRSVAKTPRVAEQCDVNIHSLTP
ncbi:hypothetical protein TNCV_4870891 [Trichonephila clavipes]|nr:hypothetical protein TNCV_4870891 [Trichonephila clavipes]